MDLATATGSDRWQLTIGGRTFQAGPITAADWGTVQAWIKREVVPPHVRAAQQLAEMDAAGATLRPADRTAFLAEARKEGRVWPPPIRSAGWVEALKCPGGDAEFVFAALKPYNPDLTREEAARLADRATPDQVVALWNLALGAGADPDPKAPSSPDSSASP